MIDLNLFQGDEDLNIAAQAVYEAIFEDGLLLHRWEDAGQMSREIYGYEPVETVYNILLEGGRIVW